MVIPNLPLGLHDLAAFGAFLALWVFYTLLAEHRTKTLKGLRDALDKV